MKCSGVFEGGGVRGIGHVGAACGMEEAGYEFVRLAGSSAGAIVAALLAAGYECGEMRRELESLDYRRFRGMDFFDHFGTVGKLFSVFLNLGLYNTDYLEEWMRRLLERKRKTRFGDMKESGRELKITVSDLTERRLLILPDDLPAMGTDPDSFSVAAAVRMSVSIPVFFEPVRWWDGNGKGHVLVDGGLLSNYPMWVLDQGSAMPERPTFGFKFSDERAARPGGGCPCDPGLVEYLKAIVSTSLEALDNSHVKTGDAERTIWIPTTVRTKDGPVKIGAVDFDLSRASSDALFKNGRLAARRFLRTWDFEAWKQKYRKRRPSEPGSR